MTDHRFTPTQIQVAAGKVSFRLVNAGSVLHDFTVLSADGQHRVAPSKLVSPGQSATVSLQLQPGSYPVICSQPGHQELGMEAVIIAS